MTQTSLVRNPFMLMLDPEVVVAAMQRSEMLEQLSRRICHPLDKPVPPAQELKGTQGMQKRIVLDDD